MGEVLGIGVWVLWFLAFVVFEANGFRKSNDRWPTLSELVKRWEDRRITHVKAPDGTHYPIQPKTVSVAVGGIATWSWQRWLVAAGLPLLAVVLELHWVYEVF